MVYFFHHYELPAVEQQAQVQSLIALAQRQQTPQHLLTVMTQTAAGQLARTTADISELRPVRLDHHTDGTAQRHRLTTSPSHSHQPPNSGAQLHSDPANMSICVSDVDTAAGQPTVHKPADQTCTHQATVESSVHQTTGVHVTADEPSLHGCHSRTDEGCCAETDRTECVDSGLKQSVCQVPQLVTNSSHDCTVQSTCSTASELVDELTVCDDDDLPRTHTDSQPSHQR